MASFYSIMGALQKQIEASLTAPPIIVDGQTLQVKAGLGWPSINVLQDVARADAARVPITVYDRKIGRNTTRWLPEVVAQTVNPATLTSLVSRSPLLGFGTATITLGGPVGLGDAVSAVLARPGAGSAAQVAVAIAGDTPTTMATKLANQINADPVLGLWVVAAALGPVVTLTSLLTMPAGLSSNCGNGGSQEREVGRRERHVQIVCWGRTQPIRKAVVDVIDGIIASDEAAFGLTLADGTVARLCYVSDYDIEDDTLEDVYRHDFMISLEYPVTVTDLLFAVLAPVETFVVDIVIDQ